MKKAIVFTALMMLITTAVFGAGGTIPGAGTEIAPFLIEDFLDFQAFCADTSYWDDYTRLDCDLDLDPAISGRQTYTQAPIAGDIDTDSTFDGTKFTGTFDGNGHVISNLTVDGIYYCGFFGYLGTGSEVKNLGIEDVFITGSMYYNAGLCGVNSGTVTNCYTTGIGSGGDTHGGLCGWNYKGTITNSYSTVSVSGRLYLGSLSGSNREGTIINCYATGPVTGANTLGGLCGLNYKGTIIKSYATGLVTGSHTIGGVCGKNDDGNITKCFWDVDTSGISDPEGGLLGTDTDGMVGMSTTDMQAARNYSDVGWDFRYDMTDGLHQFWEIPSGGGYPVLSYFNGYMPATLSGNGTENDPYLINNALELGAMYYSDINAYYKLGADIDLSEIRWSTAIIPVFSGSFDGDGHTIRNLTIDTTGSNEGYLGLFGSISGASSEVKNIVIEDFEIIADNNSSYIGGLCGYNNSGTLKNCSISGTVTVGDSCAYLGGLCGNNTSGTINECHSDLSISSGSNSTYLGGLCGYTEQGEISKCGAVANITIEDSLLNLLISKRIGGLCGSSSNSTIITSYANCSINSVHQIDYAGGFCGDVVSSSIINCYSSGSINVGDHSDYIGGFSGKLDAHTFCKIKNCYSACVLTAGSNSTWLGAFSAWVGSINVSNCYYYLLGGPYSLEGSPNDNSVGLKNSQMQEQASYAGFDFTGNSQDGEDDLWTLVEGHLPKLSWQSNDGPMATIIETTLSGNGYSDDPYHINNVDDLMEFSSNKSLSYGHYVLNADIDASGLTFTDAVVNRYFGGSFDGNRHVIRNVTIESSGSAGIPVGFFSFLKGIDTSIENFGLENINVSHLEVGGYTGGLCGYIDDGSIVNCYVTGQVAGHSSTGGLCGMCRDAAVDNCYSKGFVICENESRYVGGLCGYSSGGEFTNCYSTGPVYGGANSMYVGGLVGRNYGDIFNSYSIGNVNVGANSRYVGGLVGSASSSNKIKNSYFYINAGLDNGHGIALDDAQMQTKTIFADAGWDFDSVWDICDGLEYPRLRWQILSGDLVCPYGVDAEDLEVFIGCWLDDVNMDSDVTTDGIVNLVDLAALAQEWLGDCSAGCGTDVTGDDNVNQDDLYVFTDQWLKTDECVIADLNDDDLVRLDDMAIFSSNWLDGRTPILGDINRDYRVDLIDMSRLSVAWQAAVGDANWDAGCDLYADALIDILDLIKLAEHWLEHG